MRRVKTHAPIGLFVFVVAVMMASSCGGGSGASSGSASPPFSQTDTTPGTGAAAEAGKRVTVSYTGWLYDPAKPEGKGAQFDSAPEFTFNLGRSEVITGWDQGVVGMKVGGKRRLVIPPDLAYGATGAGGVIPPNATLVFEVGLMDVR